MKVLDDYLLFAQHEFGGATIGDKRLRERLLSIAAAFAAKPSESIPQACGSKAATKAAYRFLGNSFVDPEDIDEGHRKRTIERCKSLSRVLVPQDTTELDFDDHPATKGLGPRCSSGNQGLLMHSTLALTPEGVPLGLIDRLVWARDPQETGRKHKRKELPIEFKESYKWLSSLNMTNVVAEQCPRTHFVNEGDREADVFDLFALKRRKNVDLLVRASWDRRVDHPENYLFKRVESQPVAATFTLHVPRRKGQPARDATMQLRYGGARIRPPKHRSSENLEAVKLTAILVEEINAPEGIKPLRWLLLTTCKVRSVEDALACVGWYSRRWGCEIFHFVLKSGCKIESLQLQDAARLERCLSIYVVVAWRLLYLLMLGRVLPDVPCEVVLDEVTWQALYCAVHKVPTPPLEPPTLKEAVLMIARLGGFLGRKSDGDPGVKTLWRGLQRLADFRAMYEVMRPPAPDPSRKRSGER